MYIFANICSTGTADTTPCLLLLHNICNILTVFVLCCHEYLSIIILTIFVQLAFTIVLTVESFSWNRSVFVNSWLVGTLCHSSCPKLSKNQALAAPVCCDQNHPHSTCPMTRCTCSFTICQMSALRRIVATDLLATSFGRGVCHEQPEQKIGNVLTQIHI